MLHKDCGGEIVMKAKETATYQIANIYYDEAVPIWVDSNRSSQWYECEGCEKEWGQLPSKEGYFTENP